MADGRQRLDRWLWFARVTKSRTLAQRLVEGGGVRVNRLKVLAPAHALKVGDVLTIADGRGVRVLAVRDLGVRRGPAAKAACLYEDMAAPREPGAVEEGPGQDEGGESGS